MWVQSFARKCRDVKAGAVNVLCQNVSNSEAGQGFFTMVQEHSAFGAKVQLSLCAKRTQFLVSLWPQGAEPLLAAFTEQAELIRSGQLKIAGPQVEHLLDAGSGVEHGHQQRIVAAPVPTRSVYSRKDGFDLGILKVLNDALSGAFEWHCENALSTLDLVGMPGSDITQKGVNGGEADIACWHAIVPVLFQIGQKRKNLVRLNIIQVQVANVTLSLRSQEAKQEDQTVSIAVNGVRAHAAKPGQMVCKVVTQTGREPIRRRGFHVCAPFCSETAVTNLP
jgi:hypothetical protein